MKHQLLLIEDNQTLNQLMVKELSVPYRVKGVTNWKDAKDFLERTEPDLIISDVKLPDTSVNNHIDYLTEIAPTVLLTAYANIEDAVSAMKAGATDYLVKPVRLEKLLLTIDRALEINDMKIQHQFLKQNLNGKQQSEDFIGDSGPMQEVKHHIAAVAKSEMSVLITGESGTGKELTARYIHQHSDRAEQNFVTVDCCTIQENLFESELFGHEKGAFTGADSQKKGLVEGAKGGTLFLDEIGEVNMSVQTKLLRLLESGTFRRLGGTKTLHSNARVVAATNRQNLLEMCNEGSFRLDLYYRLNAFSIQVPPLRERREDISALAEFFLANHKFSQRIQKDLSAEAKRALVRYHWPGNVRELKNVIERAIILSHSLKRIKSHHLSFDVNQTQGDKLLLEFDGEPSLDDLTLAYLKKLLVKFSGRRSQIARALGVSERSVYRMIKRYKLHKSEVP